MGKPTGFIEFGRETPRRRPVPVRLRDWREVYEPADDAVTTAQAARCMDCGIPFCHEGCPLGNLIPEWNDLVYRGDWATAIERLHATNNFPEFTGRLCPAPCEGSCVLGINQDPVTIERIELEIIEHAFAEGWVTPHVGTATGKTVAVVGSGPAGLAAAQQLTRAGHAVTVFERAEAPGGLLRYGIPEFKMEKWVIDRRIAQLEAEGVRFRCGISVVAAPTPAASNNATVMSVDELQTAFDAVVIATGSTTPRDLTVPGREASGIAFAMDYLRPSNLVREGRLEAPVISAAGKHVVIIGGGDTGADCLGTALRQGAESVVQLEIMPQPPQDRSGANPWPTWPVIFRVASAHEEGGERRYSVQTTRFITEDGAVTGLEIEEVDHAFQSVPGTTRVLRADLVLLAMGFTGPERALPTALGLAVNARGTVEVDQDWRTSTEGVFACGDAARGQSLIVWAIAEGRSCAAAVDAYLMGGTELPAPIIPGQRALA
jgi:glutamate synthase (NADPH) small chain